MKPQTNKEKLHTWVRRMFPSREKGIGVANSVVLRVLRKAESIGMSESVLESALGSALRHSACTSIQAFGNIMNEKFNQYERTKENLAKNQEINDNNIKE